MIFFARHLCTFCVDNIYLCYVFVDFCVVDSFVSSLVSPFLVINTLWLWPYVNPNCSFDIMFNPNTHSSSNIRTNHIVIVFHSHSFIFPFVFDKKT